MALLFACDDGAGGGGALDADAADVGDSPFDGGAAPDARPPLPDAEPPRYDAGAGAPDSGAECSMDRDCGDQSWCDTDRRCVPAAESLFVDVPADGVTRAAAGAFDITPAYLETWTDRAGPDCRDNVAGRFDGRIDEPSPEDPCRDGFDDANDNGRFDAIWLGGAGANRPAAAVDNALPPEGRVLLLAREDQLWLLITLDVHAIGEAAVRDLARRIRLRLGIPETAIAIQATGTRAGPDAVGLWGPDLAAAPEGIAAGLARLVGERPGAFASVPVESGVDAAWWADVQDAAVGAVEAAGRGLTPVQVRTATAALPMRPDPAVGGPIELPDVADDGVLNDSADLAAARTVRRWLSRDHRWPQQRDRLVRAFLLESTVGENAPVAVGLTWGAAPATRLVEGAQPLCSADFPGAARAWIEDRSPGAVAIFMPGAADDAVVADALAFVPAVDTDGRLLDLDDEPVEDAARERAAEAKLPTDSLGRLLATRAWRALQAAEAVDAQLEVSGRYAWVPLTNPRWGLAARLGVLPGLSDWLTGRRSTNAWASAQTAPSCGGLGCLRYRLDRVSLGPVALLTTPGALDDGFVRGRRAATMAFGGARAFVDLDADGVLDADDPEIRARVRAGDQQIEVVLPAPLNPQQFAGLPALESDTTWVVGRTNGGAGSLRESTAHVNVFEGALQPLLGLVADEVSAQIEPCQLGYPCDARITLGELAEDALSAQPETVGSLLGSHELWVVEDALTMPEPPDGEEDGEADGGGGAGGAERVPEALAWWIESPEGMRRAEGEALIPGPGNRGFTLEVDLAAAGVVRNDRLFVPALSEMSFTIGGVVPVELRAHPNAADAWWSSAGAGGNLVYNAACALAAGGECAAPRPAPPAGDPNETLPQVP